MFAQTTQWVQYVQYSACINLASWQFFANLQALKKLYILSSISIVSFSFAEFCRYLEQVSYIYFSFNY
jgi:hypothetical protein